MLKIKYTSAKNVVMWEVTPCRWVCLSRRFVTNAVLPEVGRPSPRVTARDPNPASVDITASAATSYNTEQTFTTVTDERANHE
jgi:hypothetical protein